MTFRDADTDESLDTSLFNDSRSVDSAEHVFEILAASAKGTYNIIYSVDLEMYDQVASVDSQPFTVEYYDPCDAPSGISAPEELETTIDYTVT